MLAGLTLALILLGGTSAYNKSRLERFYEPPQYWYMASDSLFVTPRDQRKAERASRKIARQERRHTKTEELAD